MFAMNAILIFIIDLINCRFSLTGLFQNWGVAAVNCSAAVFFAMVLTMAFEYLFDIASNMTLIELADMSHPILKRLSIEAAGTYNHSVLVGNLAESAAERIGGNSLFARVASYYHDIGKIEKAGYFIENMTTHEKSKHAKLSPNLSALIISSHVKEGAELARKYKLPRVIRDAIMQHHGTSTVSYFYQKAREQDPHNQVLEEHFRYSGPLPQSRENAIIMLADAVEAASRSLSTSSPKLLRDLVKKIVRDKFSSAQLDQSNLTLRDLDEIMEGFMPILQGIFHTRDTVTKER
jgi:putative nucleotidyltransferase with HDIG domain